MRAYFKGVFRDGSGNPVASGQACVFLAGTDTAAAVYTSLAGTTSAAYVTSGSDGTFEFWVDRFDYDESQKFKIIMSKTGYTSATWDNVIVDQLVLGTYSITSPKTVSAGVHTIPYGITIALSSTGILNCSNANTTLCGEGSITQAAAGVGAIAITASNVTVDGLTITGKQHAAYNTGETAVYATGTDDTTRITDITVKNCIISNWGWEGIRFDYVDRATARGNYVYDIVYSGIQGRNANYTDFSHNVVTDITPGSSGLLVGITLSGSTSQVTAPKHGRIANNYIYNTGQAILLEPAEHVTVTGNDILDCLTGVDVKYHTTGGVSKYVTVTGNNIINLTLTTTQQKGIDVAGDDETTQTENVTVAGNVVYGYGNTSDSRGAIQTGAAKGLVVTGNTISNSQKYAMLIGAYTDYSVISGNNIYGMQTVASSSAVFFGTACDYTVIKDNNINAGAYVGINIPGANPKLFVGQNVINTTYTSSISGLANCIPARYREQTATTVTGNATGDLKTYVIGKDTISAGNSIRFEAAGTKGGGTGNKQIDIVLGSTTITAHAAANNTTDWRIVGTIMFSTTAAQQISWICWDGTTITQGYDTATEDTAAADVTLKLSAVVSGAADTVVQRLWIVDREY